MADSTQPAQNQTPYQDDPSQPPPPESVELPSTSTSPAPHIRRLTLVSASLAITSFIIGVLEFVLYIVGNQFNNLYLSWDFQTYVPWLVFVVILATLISTINAYRIRHELPLPMGINLLMDLVIALIALFNAIPAVIILGDVAARPCRNYGYDSRPCGPLKLVVCVIAIFVVSLIIVFGLVHTILLFVRATAAYTTRRRLRPGAPLSLPTGQVTFEFSLKLFRKPEPTIGQQNAQAEGERESLV